MIKEVLANLARKLYPWLERWQPLPPVELRRPRAGLYFLMPELDFKKDTDFLAYRHLMLMLKFMVFIAVFLIVDAGFKLGWVVNPIAFEENPLIVATQFRNLSIIPFVFISLAFYIRIRFSMNLALENPTITCHPALYDDEKQGNWVFRSSIVLLISPFVVLASDMMIEFISERLSMGADGVFFVTLFAAFAVSGASVFLVMHAIMIEKSYRYFGNLMEHLAVMTAERDAKTDKYVRRKKEPK